LTPPPQDLELEQTGRTIGAIVQLLVEEAVQHG
jgi:hypothetical protein